MNSCHGIAETLSWEHDRFCIPSELNLNCDALERFVCQYLSRKGLYVIESMDAKDLIHSNVLAYPFRLGQQLQAIYVDISTVFIAVYC